MVADLLDLLREELGEELLAVWLYGSRARGEADLTETHPDRRSDVDLMVVVREGADPVQIRWGLAPHLEAIADNQGDSPVWYSVHVYPADRVRERRRIASFFLQAVDRDKVVLLGDGLDEQSR